MTIYLLVREDQNQHGFVDTGVIPKERGRRGAPSVRSEVRIERQSGTWVEGEERVVPLDDWNVALRIEEHVLGLTS